VTSTCLQSRRLSCCLIYYWTRGMPARARTLTLGPAEGPGPFAWRTASSPRECDAVAWEAVAIATAAEAEQAVREAGASWLRAKRELRPACYSLPAYEKWHRRLLLTLAPPPLHGSTGLLEMAMSSSHVYAAPD